MLCRDVGLLIQSIEPNGRIHRDGRLRENDRIVAINGISLIGTDFYSSVYSNYYYYYYYYYYY